MRSDVVYRGHTDRVDHAAVVEVWIAGQLAGLLQPSGKHAREFAWGYAGSGPSELARSLLIDFYADDAACPRCKGEGKTVWRDVDGEAIEVAAEGSVTDLSRGYCTDCGGERFVVTPSLYHRFKNEFVARWPQDGSFELAGDDIARWLATVTT